MGVYKTHYVNLDMYEPPSGKKFRVVEGDTANIIQITLTDRGVPVDLTGCKVLVAFAKGAQPVEQDTDGNGVTITGDDHNVILVDLYASSFTNGENTAQVVILSGEGSSLQATSARFNFDGERAIISENTLPAEPSWPLLQTALNTLANIARGVQADWAITDTLDPAHIKNKPTIPSTPAEVGAAAAAHAAQHGPDGDDPVTPIAHAAQHAADQPDAVSASAILAAGKSVIFNASLLAASWGADCANLFDEIWAQGSLNDSTGAEASSSNHIRSTDYTSVTAGTTYSYADSIGAGARIFWYTASAFVSYSDVAQNGTVTAPATATRARIRLYNASAIVPADARWTMINSGATIKEWEPQGRGIHIKAEDYSELATITVLTAIEAVAPLSKNATLTQIEALQAANIFDGTQVGATEIVLHARGDVPTIDLPVRILVRGDLY